MMGEGGFRGGADFCVDLIQVLAQCCDLRADCLALTVRRSRSVQACFEPETPRRQFAVKRLPPLEQCRIQARSAYIECLIIGHRPGACLFRRLQGTQGQKLTSTDASVGP